MEQHQSSKERRTKQIKDHILYFGTEMQEKFFKSAKKLLSYAGQTYGVSTQMSIELGTTTIAKMDKPSYMLYIHRQRI